MWDKKQMYNKQKYECIKKKKLLLITAALETFALHTFFQQN